MADAKAEFWLDGRGLFLGLISGSVLALTFPDFDRGYLAWVGLVPLLYALRSCQKVKSGFLIAFVAGLGFHVGIFYWGHEIPGFKFNLLDFALSMVYLASYWGFFGLTLLWVTKRLSFPFAMTAPSIWVTMEYMRSNLSFLALPWGILGTSQYRNLALIQIASITGIYGISFLLVFVNAAICETILTIVNAPGTKTLFRRSLPVKDLKKIVTLSSSAAFILCALFAFGCWEIAKPLLGRETVVATLQTSIGEKKKERKTAQQIVRDHPIKLSRSAASHNPELIVWPESSVPVHLRQNLGILSDICDLQIDTKCYLVIGTSERQKFKRAQPYESLMYNSAFLFSPKGQIVGRYHKIRLFPFAEYLPLRGIFPWPSWIVPDMDADCTPGKDHKVFSLPEAKFSVVICWESIFPGLVREFVRRGAQFLVNISNEGMIKGTPGPCQLLAMSVFRAVENRIFVVRSTNGGISCFIDPKGKVTGSIRAKEGGNPGEGVSAGRVITSHEMTLYTRYGDLFAYLNIITTICLVTVSLRSVFFKKH